MTRAMTEVLRTQWLASRWLLVPIVLLCIGLPQAVVRLATRYAGGSLDRLNPGMTSEIGPPLLIGALEGLSAIFPFLAAITGAAIALAAWNWDHRTNHVYALALPVPRSRYALMKLWAGALILLVPTLAIWIGAWLATAGVMIPDGLRAYPLAFTARFLLAALLIYATMFALAAGTIRTTLVIFIGSVLLLMVMGVGLPLLHDHLGVDLITPLQTAWYTMLGWPGPFEVFGGSWLLIDV
ncbi:MAG: hypothetical protein KFH98_14270 [Gemmatimonadetes bacterium]|nr:hypothetical protein [Gemmatimonadota bacterium]